MSNLQGLPLLASTAAVHSGIESTSFFAIVRTNFPYPNGFDGFQIFNGSGIFSATLSNVQAFPITLSFMKGWKFTFF